MRLATFNVENMFERPKAMNLENWDLGAKVLEDFKRLNELILREHYTEDTKLELLKIMHKHKGLVTQSASKFIRLRDVRGKFIVKHKNKPAEIAASGRDDWIGWFELEKEPIKALATENTGRVIGLLQADVLCVIEAENRVCLKHFNEDVLPHVDTTSFNYVMLIDGNDTRGIDVGIMTKKPYEINHICSHVDDTDETGIIFSRDCPEFEIKTTNGEILLVLINHFKSKGYGNADESAQKRFRQAKRVREIYEDRLAEGYDYIAIMGDLNSTPDENSLDPLLRDNSTLTDIMAHDKFAGDNRPGTHGNGTKASKLDYILLSPKLASKVIKGGIERRGVWGGKSGTLFPHLPTMETAKDAASDHAALWAEVEI